MLHKTCPNSFHCPVEATLQLIGGKYKTLILWHLIDKTLRFNQLQKLLPQATAKMLTQQLRELETDGLIIRTVYPVVPPKVEYRLSDFGATIIPGAASHVRLGRCLSCAAAGRSLPAAWRRSPKCSSQYKLHSLRSAKYPAATLNTGGNIAFIIFASSNQTYALSLQQSAYLRCFEIGCHFTKVFFSAILQLVPTFSN